MALKDLKSQLLALPTIEKAQAIQLLTQHLGGSWRGIEKNPGICGGSACITNTRIAVWILVEAKRVGYTDADLLLSYPTLTAIDLANAWIYAEAYPDEIEETIQINEVA